MELRECPFCGKAIPAASHLCPACRETMPDSPLGGAQFVPGRARPVANSPDGNKKIRQGLLYMLLAGVIGYFTTPAAIWKPPIPVPTPVTSYLSLLLFLGGLGLTIYGFYLRHRSLVDSAQS